MKQAACFTGHRPKKLFQGGITEEFIRRSLLEKIEQAIGEGYTVFYCGMAQGTDLIAGEIVLEEEKTHPQLRLIAVVPYLNQQLRWEKGWRDRYQRVLDSCQCVVTLHSSYQRNCFMERNRYMVEHSELVIGVYNGSSGGTRNTLDLAGRFDRTVRVISC